MVQKKRMTSVQVGPEAMVVATDQEGYFIVFTRKSKFYVYSDLELMDEFDLTEEEVDDIEDIMGGNINVML